MEPTLQPRRDLMDGYILTTRGATVDEAIHSADISIPNYRQHLISEGCEIVTQYNMNDKSPDLRSEPPSLEMCQHIIDVVDKRKEEALEYFEEQLAECKDELENSDLSRGDRSFYRERAKALQRKMDKIANEDVTAEELHKAFLREDVTLRAKMIPTDLREMLDALRKEQDIAKLL